jgi:hypothetical protein
MDPCSDGAMGREAMSPVIEAALSDRHIIAGILDVHPQLWWGGWWTPQLEMQSPPGLLERRRRETTDASGVGQFRRAMAF